MTRPPLRESSPRPHSRPPSARSIPLGVDDYAPVSLMCTSKAVSESVRDFYRTEMGKNPARVEETEEGALTVAVLKEGSWALAPLGMIGLRLSPNTRRLTASEIKNLPQ